MTLLTPAALAAAALLASGPDPIVLKLGTLAPSGSSWHEALKDLAGRWEEASGGAVRVRVYAGGVQGSEGDMLRKLGIGQLQAVGVTNVGLHDLVPEPQAFSVPLLFRDAAEAACTFDRLRPRLDAAMLARGLVVVQWTRLGQASFFCNAPLHTPAEVAGARMFAWEGDPGTVKAWREAGFRPVVLSSTDLYPALSTRMIDCVGQLPVYMLTTRAFEHARNRIDLPWGEVLGAIVLRKETWEKIPERLRPALLAAAAEIGERMDADARRLERDALDAMARAGLTSVRPDPEPWRVALERSWPVLRGEVVPAAFFDEVVATRNACRAEAARVGGRGG